MSFVVYLASFEGEKPWCRGEQGRRHVTEESKPNAKGASTLTCKHCGKLCAMRVFAAAGQDDFAHRSPTGGN